MFREILTGVLFAAVAGAQQQPAPAAPDFLARAQAIWGEQPEGTALSALVEEGRGSRFWVEVPMYRVATEDRAAAPTVVAAASPLAPARRTSASSWANRS